MTDFCRPLAPFGGQLSTLRVWVCFRRHRVTEGPVGYDIHDTVAASGPALRRARLYPSRRAGVR
jgi:hypothetical protein